MNDRPAGGSSGTEVHLDLLLDGLRRAGDDAELFTRPARTGVGRLNDVWDPAARRALEAAVSAYRPDVLHFHNVVRELSAAVLRAAPEVPRVLTVHDGRLLGDADGRRAALRWWQRRVRAPLDGRVARRAADVTLAVSGPLSQRLRAAGFRNVVQAVPWAAPPITPPVAAQQVRDVVFVGRLDVDKGLNVLLAAFATLDDLEARLLVAGCGALEPAVRRAAAGSGGRVVALGRLDRAAVSRLMGSARVVVLPSLPGVRPEGAPLALVEGLVHGRPLVVSDDPGSIEVARADGDRPAGLVTRAGDAADLAAALRAVLTDDALVQRLAGAAASYAPEHTEAAGVARVRDSYRLAGAA